MGDRPTATIQSVGGSAPSSSGWACATCGVFVSDGASHVCTGRVQWQPASQIILFWPCNGTNHDYAVGPTHAVCNRCDKVMKLDA